jgi:hypothetical protein
MTKTHDYAGALAILELYIGPDNGLGQTALSEIRHALTVMEKLPWLLDGMKVDVPYYSQPNCQCCLRNENDEPYNKAKAHNAALDAVLDKMKQMEKNDE